MKQEKKKKYDFDNRLDYIAYMFNVRTRHKAYENFIVNAIYARVGNPELKPVTQQYVKSKKLNKTGKTKRPYYLLDLYFPQLNYGIEIDERHHNNEENQEADIVRAEDIKAAIECVEERIPIYTEDNLQRSIEDIDLDINRIVEDIKKMIAQKGGVTWITNEQEKEIVKKRGYFMDTDEADYKGITEIYNICGGCRTGADIGREAVALGTCYVTLNRKYKLWVPKMAIKLEDGKVTNTANGYENYLSEDHRTIYEYNVDKQWNLEDQEKDKEFRRVVFMQMKNKFGQRCVKFLGV